MILPRWMAKAEAFVRGTFWLPCPQCGKLWSGSEWARSGGHPSIPCPGDMTGNVHRGVCSYRCVADHYTEDPL